jgi:hypothetical protein
MLADEVEHSLKRDYYKRSDASFQIPILNHHQRAPSQINARLKIPGEPLATVISPSSIVSASIMHRRHASSVLSILLVVANTVALSSPFPRSRPHGQLGPAPASEVPNDLPHAQARTLKSKLPINSGLRHDASNVHNSERSSFALNSPKSLFARHIRAKNHFRRVAKRHDLTDGYGSLPTVTDPSAVVGWASNGYGKGDETLVNGYGAVPESLRAMQAGSGVGSSLTSGAKRDGTLDRGSAVPPGTHSPESRNDFTDTFLSSNRDDSSGKLISGSLIDATSGGPLVDTTSGEPVIGIASGHEAPPTEPAPAARPFDPSSTPIRTRPTPYRNSAKFKSHYHGSSVRHFTPKNPTTAADNVCEVQVSSTDAIGQPFYTYIVHFSINAAAVKYLLVMTLLAVRSSAASLVSKRTGSLDCNAFPSFAM